MTNREEFLFKAAISAVVKKLTTQEVESIFSIVKKTIDNEIVSAASDGFKAGYNGAIEVLQGTLSEIDKISKKAKV